MGKLLEVIRRLTVSIVYVVGLFFAGLFLSEYWDKNTIQAVAGFALIGCATYLVHQLVNWILLKDEKNAPPGN